MPVFYKVTVGRSYDYQKVEVEATSGAPLDIIEANKFRQEVAKLGDEAFRELKRSHSIAKKRDELLEQIHNLEVRYISTYPTISDGENTGLIDTSKLDKDEVKKLREYKSLREAYADTFPYNYKTVDIATVCQQVVDTE